MKEDFSVSKASNFLVKQRGITYSQVQLNDAKEWNMYVYERNFYSCCIFYIMLQGQANGRSEITTPEAKKAGL